MALDIDIPFTDIEKEQEQPSKTYRLDLDSKRIIGTVDGLEAVKQAVRKAVVTIRYEHLIYDDDYGSEAYSLIHDGECSRELIQTALPELIKDALSQDSRILSCDDFSFGFEEQGSVSLSFEVKTVFGNTRISEVI